MDSDAYSEDFEDDDESKVTSPKLSPKIPSPINTDISPKIRNTVDPSDPTNGRPPSPNMQKFRSTSPSMKGRSNSSKELTLSAALGSDACTLSTALNSEKMRELFGNSGGVDFVKGSEKMREMFESNMESAGEKRSSNENKRPLMRASMSDANIPRLEKGNSISSIRGYEKQNSRTYKPVRQELRELELRRGSVAIVPGSSRSSVMSTQQNRLTGKRTLTGNLSHQDSWEFSERGSVAYGSGGGSPAGARGSVANYPNYHGSNRSSASGPGGTATPAQRDSILSATSHDCAPSAIPQNLGQNLGNSNLNPNTLNLMPAIVEAIDSKISHLPSGLQSPHGSNKGSR
tara:strand:- start:1575 stop:2609 length:1035 start_codon:yes stop_codon:yes gene_type:complete